MRWIPFLLLTLAGALLEAGNLLNLIALGDWHIRPAPLMILLVFVAVHCRLREAAIASFVLGLAMDMAGSQMGPHTFSYCLVGGLLCQLTDYFPSRRFLHQAAMIFAVYLIAETLAYWLRGIKTGDWQEYGMRIILLTAVYSACAGPLVWRGLRRIMPLIVAAPSHGGRGYLR